MKTCDIQSLPRIEGNATRGVPGVVEVPIRLKDGSYTTGYYFWTGNEWKDFLAENELGDLVAISDVDAVSYDLDDFSEVK